MGIRIESYTPEGEDWGRVGDKLTAYTASKGAPPYAPLNFAFRAVSEDGSEVYAEAIATYNQGEAELNLLYVEESERGKGIGAELVGAFEVSALGLGAVSAIIKTPTWQGEGYYERLGYHEQMRIPVLPDNQGRPQSNVTYYKDLRVG
jgi:GNAT superfamily N-acetyltransferase